MDFLPRASTLMALSLIAGCFKLVGGSFVPTKQFTVKPRTASDVSLHLGSEMPSCPVSRVGLVTYDAGEASVGGRNPSTDAQALVGLRDYLATLGVDGALEVRCGGTGTTGVGVCQGVAYVCEASGGPGGA